MTKAWHGGKGSSRRRGANDEAYRDNWDRIFGKSKRENALNELTQLSQEMGLYEHEVSKIENETDIPSR